MINFIFIFFSIFRCTGSSLLSTAVSSCSELGLLFTWLLIAVASLVAEHGLSGVQASVAAALGLSSYGSRALELRLSSYGAQA